MIKRSTLAVTAAIAAFGLAACGNEAPATSEWHSAFDSNQAAGCTQTDCVSLNTPTTTSEAPPSALISAPEAKDFKVELRTFSKQCFRSAGCNTVVEPQISFLGANTLISGYECDLTYTITGDESGEIVETAVNTGGTEYSVSRSVVSTPKSKTKIDVSVTSVSCHR
ncbi:hypothetical protein OG943_03220 [Amycolatopsis sp. NBC_00345]|uniref:hypothetical protein n=1 Tax=Amycolatopsis sp. NBC_00345 TaxID=2975955 RepID=UPI002E26617C